MSMTVIPTVYALLRQPGAVFVCQMDDEMAGGRDE